MSLKARKERNVKSHLILKRKIFIKETNYMRIRDDSLSSCPLCTICVHAIHHCLGLLNGQVLIIYFPQERFSRFFRKLSSLLQLM